MPKDCDAAWDEYDAAFRATQADGRVVSERLCAAFVALNTCLGADDALHRFTAVCRQFRAGQTEVPRVVG
jgi:hypothetical protein